MEAFERLTRWQFEADVVVRGFSLAGAVTAMTAIDADVLIVKKMPEGREGGSSRVSGQTLLPAQDVEKLMAYQRRLIEPNPIPESQLRVCAESMVEFPGFSGDSFCSADLPAQNVPG